MGMPVTMEVPGAGVSVALLDAAFAEFRRLDAVFSTFREDSIVSAINAGNLSIDSCRDEVVGVAALCRAYSDETDGVFNAWRNGVFDPSGIVKGLAIDRAGSILERGGCRDYFVDGAGDVLARGRACDGGPWRVGIRHPWQRDKVVRVVLASDLAVATSGTYEKGAHVYDGRTGRSTTELVSFTVVGPDIVEADVYATAGLAMGRRGVDLVLARPRYGAYAIDGDGMATFTPGFDTLCDLGLASVRL